MIWIRAGLAMAGTLGVLALRGDGREYGRAPRGGDRIPSTVAEAEAEGLAHAPLPAGVTVSSRVLATRGSAARRCINADFHETRAGDFAIGPLHSATTLPGDGKMYFAPAWPGRSPGPRGVKIPLTVRITRIDTAGPPLQRLYELSGQYAYIPGDSAMTTPFYTTGIVFPALGRYLLVATAGENWGCLIVYGGVRQN